MDNRPSILIVDDDKNTRDGLERALRHSFGVKLAESGEKALAILREGHIDLLLTDLRMPGMDGLALLRKIQGLYPNLICILLTAYGSVEIAVEAMKQGAYDFLTKPVNLEHLEMLIKRALHTRAMEVENQRLQAQLDHKFGMENVLGNSAAMLPIFDTIRQAAPTQATILIRGASGTGKELVAQAIHRLSTRAKGPFVAVHCAALTPSLLESELFGHERGAFTGAVARRRGRFEMADGGTLFLDEISEIDASIQVMLLRVLEERCFERVGGSTPVQVDIRLIAATNRNLEEMIAQGRFREDLFFRLNVVDIVLPPLSERYGDVPLLCDHFIKEFAERNNKAVEGLTTEALDILNAYHWPGNVRELRNTIEKMVVLSRGERLTVRDVPVNIREAVRASATPKKLYDDAIADGSLADMERRKIFAALQKHGANRTQAALELGISRRTLHRKLREYKELGLLGE